MEGAAGTITKTNNGWIRKTLKRSQRGKTRPVEQQLTIQNWCHTLLTPANGYDILFTPTARAATNGKYSYNMEEIDASEQIMKVDNPELGKELVRFHKAAIKAGYFMNDIELYKQPDDRVAVLDFDKVGDVIGDQVTFPPSTRSLPLKDAVQQYYLTEDLSRNIVRNTRSKSRNRSRNKSRNR